MASFASGVAVGFPARGEFVRRSGFFSAWLVGLAFALGIFVLQTGSSRMVPLFFLMGYGAMACVFVRTLWVWADPLNPLCLMIAVGLVRFSLPGILLFVGVEPPHEIARFFELMKLAEPEWLWGHALAVHGILAALLGWLLIQSGALPMPRRGLQFYLSAGTASAAAVGMLVGAAALLVFVVSNASLAVVGSGEFRDTTIQTGTGKYFFLAYLLIAGSVLLAGFLLRRGHRWLSFAPAGCCLLFYGVLGGRARAMIAVAGVLLLYWYLRRETHGWRKLSVKPIYFLIAPLAGLLIVWLSYIGAIYRGDSGARGIVEGLSFAGLWAYVQSSIFTDIGQLHGLAGAIAVGPGVLNGQTFLGAFAWPLTSFLPIPARSTGVFIVETLAGFQPRDERWGVNASLIGDGYVNFGLWGGAAAMLLYGALLKSVYLRFRQGRLNVVVYALGALYALQIFWVSVEVWPQAVAVLGFTYLLMFLGGTLFRIKS